MYANNLYNRVDGQALSEQKSTMDKFRQTIKNMSLQNKISNIYSMSQTLKEAKTAFLGVISIALDENNFWNNFNATMPKILNAGNNTLITMYRIQRDRYISLACSLYCTTSDALSSECAQSVSEYLIKHYFFESSLLTSPYFKFNYDDSLDIFKSWLSDNVLSMKDIVSKIFDLLQNNPEVLDEIYEKYYNMFEDLGINKNNVLEFVKSWYPRSIIKAIITYNIPKS